MMYEKKIFFKQPIHDTYALNFLHKLQNIRYIPSTATREQSISESLASQVVTVVFLFHDFGQRFHNDQDTNSPMGTPALKRSSISAGPLESHLIS